MHFRLCEYASTIKCLWLLVLYQHPSDIILSNEKQYLFTSLETEQQRFSIIRGSSAAPLVMLVLDHWRYFKL